LKQKITQKFQVACFDPPNGTTIVINSAHSLPINLSLGILKRQIAVGEYGIDDKEPDGSQPFKKIRAITNKTPIHGVLLMKPNAQQQV
jgi:hypothetical protein